MDDLDADRFGEVSDDERLMLVQESLNTAKGYLVFTINKAGKMEVAIGTGNCTPAETWGLHAYAERTAGFEMNDRASKQFGEGERE